MQRVVARSLVWVALSLFALVAGAMPEDDEGIGPGLAKGWEENEVKMPASPVQSELVGFYVGPTAENKFFVDPASVSVGSDGVVRYTLVVVSPFGARNVSFEGMRCETRERRLYAVGRPDGSWASARTSRWERLGAAAASNRHHAALFLEYFCPDGLVVRDAATAVEGLRRNGRASLSR